MKITVEFNSLQELDEFCNGVAIAPALAKKVSTSTKTAQEAPKAPEAKKSTPKSTKAQDEAPAKANVQETEEDEEDPKADAPAKEEKKAAGHSDGDLKLLLSDKLKRLLSDKLKAGKKTEVKKLFEKYGVTCLTALLEAQKDNLDAVYEEAEGI